MIKSLDEMLRVQQTAMGLRARRQEVLASNIANADTPNYKARDIDFKSALQGALGGGGARGSLELSRTSSGHVAGSPGGADAQLLYRTEKQSSVDGNTVDMDIERSEFLQNTMRYEANMEFVKGMLRGMESAIKG